MNKEADAVIVVVMIKMSTFALMKWNWTHEAKRKKGKNILHTS